MHLARFDKSFPLYFGRYQRANPIGVWGNAKADGSVSGMIGTIARGEADILLASAVISKVRAEVLAYPTVAFPSAPGKVKSSNH